MMSGNREVTIFLKKLDEFEKKYGAAWVKNKYEQPPKADSQYYDFAKKMHAAYVYRQQLNSPTPKVKSNSQQKLESKKNKKLKLTKSGLSVQLQSTLGAFNGGGGKTATSPEEFYERFLRAKEFNVKIRRVAEEAVEKKDLILTRIEKFFNNREIKNKPFVTSSEIKVKKEKIKKVKLAKPIGYKILEPTEELDIYYISSGIPSMKPTASIVVLKNDTVLIKETIDKKTSNEAEYFALISALLDVKTKKAVIYSNSQLVVFTVTHYNKLKAENLKPLYKKARELMGGKDIEILWIGSDKNKAAKQNRKIPFAPPVKPKQLNEKRLDLSQITLSDEQKSLFQELQTAKEPIFLTGKAGTGKSVLLQYFRQESGKNIVVCAPTGVAALNIGGQTIHSLFKIPPGFIQEDSLKLEKKTKKLLKHIDVLVIDEISMVSPDLMDAIDYLLQQAKENTRPFGGILIVMFGDLYQLPPVLNDKELLKYFEEHHGGYFFFNAKVWQKVAFTIRELTTVFRQKDEGFKTILNAVREGTITAEQLLLLNERANVTIPGEGVITLTTTNRDATKINETRLAQLQGKTFEYNAEIVGTLEKSAFPTEDRLQLKKGAQVMLVKNDKEKRWVNGTLGFIHELTDKEIKVNIDGMIHTIPKEKWDKIKYTYNEETQKIEEEIVSSFSQFPVKLAWAITIHKSQGQTYTSVAIDMGRGAFAHGQTYVALSRCKTLEGLYLKRALIHTDIIVEAKIADFMKSKQI